MSFYKDKDQSEIDGILQVFPKAFEDKFGQPLDYEYLTQYLQDLLAKRELELIESALDGLSPKSIRLMMKTIEKRKVDQYTSKSDVITKENEKVFSKTINTNKTKF